MLIPTIENPATTLLKTWLVRIMAFLLLVMAGVTYFLDQYHVAKESKLSTALAKEMELRSKLEVDNQTLTVDVTTLKASLAKQNAEIAGLASASAEKERVAAEELAKARKYTATWKSRYQDLINSPPAIPSDECKSLDIKMNQYLEMRQKEMGK